MALSREAPIICAKCGRADRRVTPVVVMVTLRPWRERSLCPVCLDEVLRVFGATPAPAERPHLELVP